MKQSTKRYADWVEPLKKNPTQSDIDRFSRDCNTKNNYYEKLYRETYLDSRREGGVVTRTYAGCMPFYNPVLEITMEDGSKFHTYGDL